MGNQCGACLGIPPVNKKRSSKLKSQRLGQDFLKMEDEEILDNINLLPWQSRQQLIYEEQRKKIESKLSKASGSSKSQDRGSFISESWLEQSRSVAEAQRTAIEALLSRRGDNQEDQTGDLESRLGWWQLQANEDVESESKTEISELKSNLVKTVSFSEQIYEIPSEPIAASPQNAVDIAVFVSKSAAPYCDFESESDLGDDESMPTESNDLNNSADTTATFTEAYPRLFSNSPSACDCRDLPSLIAGIAQPGLFDSKYSDANLGLDASILSARIPLRDENPSFEKHDIPSADEHVAEPSKLAAGLPGGAHSAAPAPVDAPSDAAALSPESLRVMQAILGGASGASVLVRRLTAGPLAPK